MLFTILSNVELDRWTKLVGASYDQDTQLPFSRAEAKNRKMIYNPHLELPKKIDNDMYAGKGKPVNWSVQNLENSEFGQMNLKKANLSGTNFKKANFTNSILEGAKLSNSDLTGANLQQANLTKADLSNSDLTGTNLQRANLTKADLRWVDLTGVDLRWANLTDAKLQGVDLTQVPGIKLCGTTMPDGKISNCLTTPSK